MSQLRKEYKEFKQIQEQNFREAAEAWTEENVILINERLNRNAIWRLNSAIQRFDSKFGKYRDKLPAVANILDNAENGLNLVITGKIGSRSAAHMLQRMSIMYNILSNFFGGDLGALLKTPAFRVAHTQPDEKIDKIIERGHNVREIKRNLAAALKPSDEERVIFRRAYKSFNMPTLDWNAAAKQLCCLSCNELKDLAGIEKVPMVVVDHDEYESGLDEAGALDTISKAGGVVVGGAVAGTIGAVKGITNRFTGPTPKDIAEMNRYLKQIEAVLPDKDPEFEAARQGLTKLSANIKKAETGAKINFDQNWFRNPTAIAISQGKQLIDIFEKLGSAWNAIKGKYKDPLSPEDLTIIEKTLNQQVNSVTAKLGRLFKVNLPKGLRAADIIKALVAVAKKPKAGAKPQQNEPAAPAGPVSTAAPTQNIKESVEYSNNIFEQVFSSLPNKVTFSEEFLTCLEEVELLAEDFEALDNVLTRFSQIKTNVDEKIEKATNNGTTVAGASAQGGQKAFAGGIPDNLEDAKDQISDIDDDNLNKALAGLKRLKENQIDPATTQKIQSLLQNSGIEGLTDLNSAEKMLTTYRVILTKDNEINQLIDTLHEVYDAYAQQNQAVPGGAPAAPAAAPVAPAQPASAPATGGR